MNTRAPRPVAARIDRGVCRLPTLVLLFTLASVIPPAFAQRIPEFPPAREMLNEVILALPDIPLRITGDLTARARDDAKDVRKGVEMLLDWQAQPPTARYTLRDAFGGAHSHLAITWEQPRRPDYRYFEGNPLQAAPLPDLVASIPGTDISWMDLSLSFLWWPDATTKGREDVRGRSCWVIDIPAPDAFSGCSGVRLWIDPRIRIMLKAEAYGHDDKPMRRMDVKSFKKINDRWVIKDIELTSLPARSKTVLRVRNVEDRTRKNYLREDGAATEDQIEAETEAEAETDYVEPVTPVPVATDP
ncbi:MAG TPA: outer membrane lipoprotein-sorting protein [Kiritimatiellia bacterium]|mgnify:CR=1 FL=1|nr:outer membrane lipoprotein-sorting protein [Kiritimatiellia bacterium]